MKHIVMLLLAALLIPFLASAQSNYKSGYVVTTTGDTIKGSIDLREWASNPKEIKFKKTPSANPQYYTLKSIISFNIKNTDSYIRYIGNISMDNTDLSKLTSYRDTSYRTDTVFIKAITQGPNVSLFSYTDDLKSRFFISDKFNSVPQELIYRVYAAENTNKENGNSQAKTEDTYKMQLYKEADKLGKLNEAFAAKMQECAYEAADIEALVNLLNNGTHMSAGMKSSTKSAIDFYAGAGIVKTSNQVDPSSGYAASGGTSNTSISPVIDGGLMMYVNGNARRLAFVVDFSFFQNQYKSSYTNRVYPYVDVTLKYTQINASLTPCKLPCF